MNMLIIFAALQLSFNAYPANKGNSCKNQIKTVVIQNMLTLNERELLGKRELDINIIENGSSLQLTTYTRQPGVTGYFLGNYRFIVDQNCRIISALNLFD